LFISQWENLISNARPHKRKHEKTLYDVYVSKEEETRERESEKWKMQTPFQHFNEKIKQIQINKDVCL
jgi:hypothetical protein